jgi:FkbM family methyltransferase
MSQYPVQFYYGIEGKEEDITEKVFSTCFYDHEIYIPADDNYRAYIFGDPIYKTVKRIRVVFPKKTRIYTKDEDIEIKIPKGLQINFEKKMKEKLEVDRRGESVEEELKKIHQQLVFVDGSLQDEYPEQCMVTQFLKSNSNVLEIGSNIGRNTVIIASLLEKSSQLVTLESDPQSVKSLKKNRFINRLHFYVEDSALSYQKLIQKNWVTIPSEEVLPGYFSVKTITYEELEEKYKVKFDTIVADCEGALYHILLSRPSILTNIEMVILENDFSKDEEREFVNQLFTDYGLKKIFSKPLTDQPEYIMKKFSPSCLPSFYEVWIRT